MVLSHTCPRVTYEGPLVQLLARGGNGVELFLREIFRGEGVELFRETLGLGGSATYQASRKLSLALTSDRST